MAECSDIQAELSAYLDGELTAQERSTLEAHLSACPQCRAALEELRSVTSDMSDLPRVAAPSSLMTKIRRDIANEPALREQTKAAVTFTAVGGSGARPRSHWAPFVMGMAALVILCLLAFVILPAVSQPHDSVALGTPPRDEAPAAKEQTVAPAVVAQDELKKTEADKDASPAPNGVAAGDGKGDGLNLLEQKEQKQKRSAAPNAEKGYRGDNADFAAKKDDAAQDRAAGIPQERAKAPEASRKLLEEKGENAAASAPAAPVASTAPNSPRPFAPPAPGAVPAPSKGAAPTAEPRRREVAPENRALRNSEAVEKQKSTGAPAEKLAAAPEKKSRAVGEEQLDAAKKADAIQEKTIGAPDPEGVGRAAFGGKPGENKGASEKAAEAKKLAEQAQGGQPKAGEDLPRQQSEQAATRRNSLQRDGAASTGGLAGNAAAKDAKNDGGDLKRAEQNGQPAPKPDVAVGGGGAGAGRGAASDARMRKAEQETLKAPGAPPAAEPPKAAAAAPAARVLLAQSQAGPAVVRIRAKDLQRAVSDLKKIVESSGGRWEDVAIAGEGKGAKEVEPAAKAKPTADANRQLDAVQSNYVAVTGIAQRESLLAKLNAYSGDDNPRPIAGVEEQRKEATDKAPPKKAAKKAPADEAGAGALDDKPREPAKPATSVAAQNAAAAVMPAGPGDAGEARIQIRIEIIPE